MTRLRSLKTVFALMLEKHRSLLLSGAALATLTSIMGLALLGISGWFITATSLAGLSVATAVAFDVFTPSASIRLLALGRTFSRYGERMATHEATLRIITDMREKLFRAWAQPEAAVRLLHRPARLLFRLTVDTETLETLYLRLFVPALAAFGTALFASVLLAAFYPLLGLACGLFLLATGSGMAALGITQGAAPSRSRAHAQEALRARTVDLVAGQTENIMAGKTDAQGQAILEAHTALVGAENRLHRLETLLGAGLNLASTLLLPAMVVSSAFLFQQGIISLPVAVLMILLCLAVFEPFQALRRGALELGRVMLAAQRLAPRLQAATAPLPLAPQATDHAVTLDTISLKIGGAFRLHPASLTIRTGERVAVVGSSGAGKSTLLHLVAGELNPTQGTVAARTCSLMGQQAELFNASLRDNLRLAAPTATDTQIWHALEAAGLAPDLRANRRDLDTVLGEGGIGLSLGQARRLSLAQQFLRAAPVLLLDEPTESVDAATAALMLECLGRLPATTTLVIATHLYREAQRADRILLLQEGRITGDFLRGTPDFDAILASLRKDGTHA